MKDKIVLFTIGVLVGAVIASGAFYVYTLSNKACTNNTNSSQPMNGQPPEIPNENNTEHSNKTKKSKTTTTDDSTTDNKTDSKTKTN